MFLGDNTKCKIYGKGVVTIKLLNDIEKQNFEVLHVLGLNKNLFLTKQFDKIGR